MTCIRKLLLSFLLVTLFCPTTNTAAAAEESDGVLVLRRIPPALGNGQPVAPLFVLNTPRIVIDHDGSLICSPLCRCDCVGFARKIGELSLYVASTTCSAAKNIALWTIPMFESLYDNFRPKNDNPIKLGRSKSGDRSASPELRALFESDSD